VIAHLIGYYLDKGLTTKKAVKLALGKLEGTWAISIIAASDPDSIILAKNGSPLFVGVGNSE
jgi:glucosamine--fructose-6-phosphate aminotransferase (isomerizing)